jgi:hypothetical protein
MVESEIQAALDQVTYKPGWSFRLYWHDYEGLWIAISYSDQNAYHHEQKWDVCVRSPIPFVNTPEDFWEWLLRRLIRIESHECREWFHVGGKPLRDPHAPGANDD